MRACTIEHAGRILSFEGKRARLDSFDHIAQPCGIQRIRGDRTVRATPQGCVVCGQIMATWDTTNVPAFKLVHRAEDA
jgi:hypothetical protein